MTDRLQEAISRIHEPWGGALCLDFANSIEPRGGPPPFAPPPGSVVRDELTSFLGLVAWTVRHDQLSPAAGAALLHAADADPAEARRVLTRGLALREAIYRAFAAVARGEPVLETDLALLHREHAGAVANAVLRETGEGFAWIWPDDGACLARPLWPVARSATDLLVTGERERIRRCPGVSNEAIACGWLFYDGTKNKSRRWCSMSECGAVTKTRRQTVRRRVARGAAPPPAAGR
ncbi:MAG: ABATE domain-containing protein [Chloroflexota bacterium]|nr:ABATE domain-containing protein [Chloroflexota bacterium]